jgi:hypothetical protein
MQYTFFDLKSYMQEENIFFRPFDFLLESGEIIYQ